MADLFNLLDEINDSQQERPYDLDDNNTREQLDEFREHIEINNDADEDDNLKNTQKQRENTTRKEGSDTPYTQLHSWWTQELACQELLPFRSELYDTIIQQIQDREQELDDTPTDNDLNTLVVSIMRMDVDRAKFILADLTQKRLAKIQEHPLYMREMVDRMSNDEISFLQAYGSLLEQHLNSTVLDHFTLDVWKQLDKPEMIDKPDIDDTFCFCKVCHDNGVHIDTGDGAQLYKAGSCLIVRYVHIQQLVLEGKVKIIM